MNGPVLAICGYQNSGKTTALCGVVERLVADGLAVAVVKHDAHGITLDVEGKDSDRLFRAGGDVWLRGPDQAFSRLHDAPLEPLLAELSSRYDAVLVEGHKTTDLPKVWLDSQSGGSRPDGLVEVVAELPFGEGRLDRLERIVRGRIERTWRERTVRGAVLVGGTSSRMGTDKAELSIGDGRLVDVAHTALEAVAAEVVRVGRLGGPGVGLPDVPNVRGPLGGVLAALRWDPDATWVVAACDMPAVTDEAVRWLLEQRAPGTWAVFPRPEGGRPEPLLAVYEPQARPLLELLGSTGSGPSGIAGHDRVATPAPPTELRSAWLNVNTPEELERARAGE